MGGCLEAKWRMGHSNCVAVMIQFCYLDFVQQLEFPVCPGTPKGYSGGFPQLLHTGAAGFLCAFCKSPLTDKRIREGAKFCNSKCYWNYLPKASIGEKNPSWNGGPVVLKCVECGKSFSVPKALYERQGGKYCSQVCMGQSQSRNRIHKKTGTYKECEQCKKPFYVQPRDAEKGIKKFCSRKCGAKAFWKRYSGPNHWHWKGGKSDERALIRSSQTYKEWRNAVFLRDSFTCQQCGRVGGQLSAHHIKMFSQNPNLRFFIPNGITLCWRCHSSIRGREKELESFYASLINRLL